jgi:hypothetical protein
MRIPYVAPLNEFLAPAYDRCNDTLAASRQGLLHVQLHVPTREAVQSGINNVAEPLVEVAGLEIEGVETGTPAPAIVGCVLRSPHECLTVAQSAKVFINPQCVDNEPVPNRRGQQPPYETRLGVAQRNYQRHVVAWEACRISGRQSVVNPSRVRTVERPLFCDLEQMAPRVKSSSQVAGL